MVDASTLESAARALFDALDRMDFDAISRSASDDVQAVDEISGGWMRGRAAMDGYFASLAGQVSNVRSTLSDVHAIELGDIGIVTSILDQEYDMAGHTVSIHAPTSLLFRRVDGEWRMALLHSVPLVE